MLELVMKILIEVFSSLGGTSPRNDSKSETFIYYGVFWVIIIIFAIIGMAVFFNYHNATTAA